MNETNGSRDIPRRTFLHVTGATIAASFAVPAAGLGARAARADDEPSRKRPRENRGRIFKSIKFGMFREKLPYEEKLRLLKEMGYDGVELNSPGGEDKKKALEASRKLDFPLHGVVDSIHWGTRLSDPSAEVRAKAVAGLRTAIEECHFVGGTAVLLVPGAVRNPETENQEQVWERSIAGIREVLPLAARLGIHILIENVWNGFCYIHDGPSNQTADTLAAYIDAIDSPWVGVYFDIGNHQKYGSPPDWIRTLGRRIVKLDVKDWGKEGGFVHDLGAGDVDWLAVRRALRDIRFSGWATAEIAGGDRERIARVARQMDEVLDL